MSEALESKVGKLKKELGLCKRKLQEIKKENENIREKVGYDVLKGWTPQKRIESQYGWVYAWLYPLSSYMNQNLNNILTPNIRNKINEIVNAIISQLAVHGKYGVTLPNDPRPTDIEKFLKSQRLRISKIYEPCIICSENRITHECHIIPRSEGGPYHRDNLINLCPLHHHLFDHHRLNRLEWAKLRNVINEKMNAAIIYTDQVHLPQLEIFWKENFL
ncbi:MAG: HNH endonuclease [Anaerolineaceae bacterium]|nr:HNH endonuclease [Anaerolineaceae bacterium]